MPTQLDIILQNQANFQAWIDNVGNNLKKIHQFAVAEGLSESAEIAVSIGENTFKTTLGSVLGLLNLTETTPTYEQINFGFGVVSTMAGDETTMTEIVSFINSTGFTITQGKLAILTITIQKKINGVLSLVRQYYSFTGNNSPNQYGESTEGGAITENQLIWRSEIVVLQVSSGTQIIDIGNIQDSTIEDWMNNMNPDNVDWEDLEDDGTTYYFSCIRNGDEQIYQYVGDLPVTLGSGNDEVSGTDFDILSYKGDIPSDVSASTSTGTIADLSNPLGTYAHMDVASSEEELTFNDGTKVLGGIYFRFINCENKPVISGAIPIKKGETFVANTDMYLVARYNGNRVEYWFEDAESDLEQYIGLPFGAIIAESESPLTDFFGDPHVKKSSTGRYIFSHGVFGGGADDLKTFVYYTDDIGSNQWTLAETFTDLIWATKFEYSGDWYILGVSDYPTGGVLRISKSTDDGETWSALTTVHSIPSGYSGWHTAPINPIFKDGYLVKAFELRQTSFSWASGHEITLVLADLTDLTNPANWSYLTPVQFDATAFVNSGIYSNTGYTKQPDGTSTVQKGFLESNIVEKSNGDLIIVARLEQSPCSNHAVKLDVTWNSGTPTSSTISTTHNFIDMPGGNVKFQIVWDSTSSKHWAVVNYNRFKYFADNRIEGYLISSDDNCETWTVHQKISGYEVTSNWEAQIPQYATQYAHFIIDGNDLLICERSADNVADSWHNANLITLTRIENFRDIPEQTFVDGSLIIDENSSILEDGNGVCIIHDQTIHQNSLFMLNTNNSNKLTSSEDAILPFDGSSFMRVVHSKYLNPDINDGFTIFVVIPEIQSVGGNQRILSKASGTTELDDTFWFFNSKTGLAIQNTRGIYSDLTALNGYILAASFDNVNEYLYNYANGSNRGAPDTVYTGTWDTDHIALSSSYVSGNFAELRIGARAVSTPEYFDSPIVAIHIIPNYMNASEVAAYSSALNTIYSIY